MENYGGVGRGDKPLRMGGSGIKELLLREFRGGVGEFVLIPRTRTRVGCGECG